MWESLPRLIKKLEEEDGARLIIFTGSGKYFAAGADFDDLRQIVDYASAARFWQAISAALETIAELELPTIAMVNGPCLGGGCLLANACDLRFAALDGCDFRHPRGPPRNCFRRQQYSKTGKPDWPSQSKRAAFQRRHHRQYQGEPLA
jgi:enoyl-CoA hydratase/carnithine racemase